MSGWINNEYLSEEGLRKIVSELNIGDLVQIISDGKFYEAQQKYQRFSGYVREMDVNFIGISCSHLSNKYVGEGKSQADVTRIGVEHIKKYKILDIDME